MCDVEKADTWEGRHQEDDVKPAVVEVELKISQHLRDDQSGDTNNTSVYICVCAGGWEKPQKHAKCVIQKNYKQIKASQLSPRKIAAVIFGKF